MKLLVVLCAVIIAAQAFDPWGKPKGTVCNSQDDCSEGECCVMNSGIDVIGKRGIIDRFSKGVCKPYKQEGDGCSPVNHKSVFNKNVHAFSCPCADGLECISTKHVINKNGFKGEIHVNPTCTVPKPGSGDGEF